MALTPIGEASVINAVFFFGSKNVRRAVSSSADLIVLNACCCSGPHSKMASFVVRRRSGSEMVAKFGMKEGTAVCF